MTTAQTVVAGVLWLAMLGLLALVLLNYRLIDRLYSSGNQMRTGGLRPGVEIRPIEVITDLEGSGAALVLPEDEEPYLLAFVSVDCDGCRTLMRTLADRKAFDGFVAAVVVEGLPQGRSVVEFPGDVPSYVAHSGYQVRRDFGVSVVPLLYVMRQKTVLAAGSVSSERELGDLLATARSNAEELRNADPQLSVHKRQNGMTRTAAGPDRLA